MTASQARPIAYWIKKRPHWFLWAGAFQPLGRWLWRWADNRIDRWHERERELRDKARTRALSLSREAGTDQ